MNKETLKELYLRSEKSVSEISIILNCSQSKINYWLYKYKIPKRSISEAVYLRANPLGDPFKVKNIGMTSSEFLYGLGLGLYWGEGTKSNNSSIRLGNTNVKLLRKFISFLDKIYGIDKSKLKFGLQIFNDCSPAESIKYWLKELRVNKDQFQKVIVSKIRGIGSYKNKSKYGVLTIYFNNKKLRDILCADIEKL